MTQGYLPSAPTSAITSLEERVSPEDEETLFAALSTDRRNMKIMKTAGFFYALLLAVQFWPLALISIAVGIISTLILMGIPIALVVRYFPKRPVFEKACDALEEKRHFVLTEKQRSRLAKQLLSDFKSGRQPVFDKPTAQPAFQEQPKSDEHDLVLD